MAEGRRAQRRREEKQQFWKGHIERWEGSGLSRREYCSRQELKLRNFTYWKSKLDRVKELEGFMRVRMRPEVKEDNESKGTALSLRIGQRYRIEVGDGFNPVTLDRLIRALQQR